ncbi:TPM domain-containing protein [Ideonella sp. DXS29W]|uniref:TPM domain-containing protein n=1 Tax=Ideonella lacteola TaxID=2984193 RepID=A0ABU9C001_9BURK
MPRWPVVLTLLGSPWGLGARWALVWALFLGLCGVGASAAWAQELQPIPALAARVTDTTGTLTAAQRQALETKLATFEREAGSQIVVLLVASTAPEDIAAYAYRVADSWKVGRRDVGDGLLILVAKDERRVRIEVAKALEGAVPDLAAKQVIDGAIRPAFKVGDYAGGLNAAIDQLSARVRGEALPAPPKQRAKKQGGQGWDQLALFFFIGVPVMGALLTGVLGRKAGGLATGGAAGGLAWMWGAPAVLAGAAGVLAVVLVGVLGIGAAGRRPRGLRGIAGAPVIWGGGGGWGSGGGGRGGGGFSSGGGGDFGGGGASGGW